MADLPAAPPRITPYELVFASMEDGAFVRIREEAQRRGRDSRRLDEFLLLGFVGATLQEMIPAEASAEALDEYTALLFAGYRFWETGRRLYVVSEGASARLTEPVYPMGDWRFAAPPACYVQLPYQRVWARVGTNAPFEPVDGFFVSTDDTAPMEGAEAEVHVLLVLGVRRDRPGLSLIPHRMTVDPRTAAARGERPSRDGAPAFANALPGGERRDFRALVTAGELEAIVLRTAHALDRLAPSLVPLPARAHSDDPAITSLPAVLLP